MNNTKLIQDIELNIKQAQLLVDTGDALERLHSNRDFKTIITEGYFREEAVRLVHLKGDPSMQAVESQASIISQMDAISSLSQYFRTVFHRALLADKALIADGETRDDLLMEDGQ